MIEQVPIKVEQQYYWLHVHNDVMHLFGDRLGLAGLGLYTLLARFANKEGESWVADNRSQ